MKKRFKKLEIYPGIFIRMEIVKLSRRERTAWRWPKQTRTPKRKGK